jgi:hypothetical protein
MPSRLARESWWRRLIAAVSDALPSPEEDPRTDGPPPSSEEESRRRLLRLKLHLLEKRGRGGAR